MSELGALIKALIAEEGPITVERYMELALGHPELGYYMNRDPFGASGDFTTGVNATCSGMRFFAALRPATIACESRATCSSVFGP